MNLEQVLQMVDDFGRTMRDAAKAPGSITPAAMNQQRERLHDAIRRLASGDQAEESAVLAAERAIAAAAIPPVDRSQQQLTNGAPVSEDHRDLKDNGQQKGYVVLTAEERAKGFVRLVRYAYVHDKCGGVTTMGRSLAETYARDPGFYGGTFCAICRHHFPVGAAGEFTWEGTTEKVGT